MVTLQICLLKDPNHLETLWDCYGTVKWQHLKCLSLRSRRLTLNPVESIAGCFEDYLEITEAFGSSHGQRTCFTQQAWGFLAVKTRRNGYGLPPKHGSFEQPRSRFVHASCSRSNVSTWLDATFLKVPCSRFSRACRRRLWYFRMRQGRRISGRGNLGMGQMG